MRVSTTIKASSWTPSPYSVKRRYLISRSFPVYYYILMIHSGLENGTENPPPAQPLVLEFDDESNPLIPSWDDEEGKPLSVLRALLSSFFNELWGKYFMTRTMSILI